MIKMITLLEIFLFITAAYCFALYSLKLKQPPTPKKWIFNKKSKTWNLEGKEPTRKPLILGIIIMILTFSIIITDIVIDDDYSSRTRSKDDQERCQICYREFPKHSKDGKSIRSANMCIQCYNNLEYGLEMLEEVQKLK